jgi:hypothetical protein
MHVSIYYTASPQFSISHTASQVSAADVILAIHYGEMNRRERGMIQGGELQEGT